MVYNTRNFWGSVLRPSFLSPDQGIKTRFPNVVFFSVVLDNGRWTKSKNPIMPNIKFMELDYASTQFVGSRWRRDFL
jgi:hypothetical protein